ncbi:VCBS repeat-containing protein, partial [Myxococcaceae bacterium JPH2]|nr:VCBS repeat-containing protein [Myxococcaceae bacterium JPH2]
MVWLILLQGGIDWVVFKELGVSNSSGFLSGWRAAMSNRVVGSRFLFASFVTAAFLGGACQSPEPENEAPTEVGVNSAGLWTESGVQLWTTGDTIPVCWIDPGFDAAKGIIRAAIESQWQRAARIQFGGFALCPTTGDQKFIRVLVNAATDAGGGGSSQLGRGGLRLPTEAESMHIAVPTNITSAQGLARLQYLAVHEFGHVLGFSHEQDRVDNSDPADATCNPPGGGSGSFWSRYDNQSVMHYCNNGGNSSGRLSVLDTRSVRKLYGTRTNGGVDFNGDGFSDVLIYDSATGYTEIRYGRAAAGLTFAAGSQTTWAAGLKVVPGDYDGDGHGDVILYSSVTGSAEVRYGQAAAGLVSAVGSQANWGASQKLVPSDFGADGYMDVLKYNSASGYTSIEYGRTLPGFNPIVQANPVWNLGF